MIVALERLAFAHRRAGGNPASVAASGRRAGTGVDFADYRRYSPGDDPRHVDWSVYARARTLFVRRFHVDDDLCLYLLVDKSGSMGLGRAQKLAFARRLAEALASVGARGNHAIGLATFSGRIETYVAPSRRREQLGRVLESLRQASPGGPSDLGRALADLRARATRRGLAVVLSDFFMPRSIGEELSILLRAGFDLAAIQILSDEEVTPVLPQEAEIWDVEGADEERVRVGPRALRRYRERLGEWNRLLREQCANRGAISRSLKSSASLSEALEPLIEAGLLEVRRA